MSRLKFVLFALGSTAIMGFNFPLGTIGLRYGPPFFIMGVRFFFAGCLASLYLYLFAVRKTLQQSHHGRKWYQPAVVGLFQTIGLFGFVYFSIKYLGVTSTESSILTYTSPMFVVVYSLLATLLTGAVFHRRQWLALPGVVLGIVGLYITLGGFSFQFNLGTVFTLAGAVCYAISTILANKWGCKWGASVLAAYQMLVGGIGLFIISAIKEHSMYKDISVSPMSLIVVLGLVVLTIFQFTLWYSLLENSEPAKASVWLFLVPPFGVFFSWLLLHEQVKWYAGVGGLLICASIFLVNWSKTKPTKSST